MPIYKVDPFWPKVPLPNKYLIQGVPTMVTDKDDHIWVLNRPRDINPDEIGASTNPPRTDCCVAAPAVLEFDTKGNLLRSWGGPGYVEGWPAPGIARPGAAAEHNIQVDREGNVWISGSNRGDSIQKFIGGWKTSLGLRPSRTPSAAWRKTRAPETEQPEYRHVPGRNFLLRPGRGRPRNVHRGPEARAGLRHG